MLCMQIMQVKQAHPSLHCHPLPFRANLMKKKCESIKLAGNRMFCQTIWMFSGV